MGIFCAFGRVVDGVGRHHVTCYTESCYKSLASSVPEQEGGPYGGSAVGARFSARKHEVAFSICSVLRNSNLTMSALPHIVLVFIIFQRLPIQRDRDGLLSGQSRIMRRGYGSGFGWFGGDRRELVVRSSKCFSDQANSKS